MSLIRILLEDFNPNQTTIGRKTDLEKIRGDLERIGKPEIDQQPKDKGEVLDMLEITSDPVQEYIDKFLQEDYDLYKGVDEIQYNKHLYDKFDQLYSEMYSKYSWDKIMDHDAVKTMYKDVKGEEPPNKQAVLDWFADYSMQEDFDDMGDWEVVMEYEYFRKLVLQTIKDNVENSVENNLYNIRSKVRNQSENINGHDCILCHREMRLDTSKDYKILRPEEGLGLYWSWEEGAENAYGASMTGGSDVVIRAWIPLASINWGETIYKNIWGLRHEKEIQALAGKPIFIKKIQINNMNSDGEDPLRSKAKFIAQTYFNSKWKEIKGDWANKQRFIKNIKQYLQDNNMINDKFSLTFDNYYKSKA